MSSKKKLEEFDKYGLDVAVLNWNYGTTDNLPLYLWRDIIEQSLEYFDEDMSKHEFLGFLKEIDMITQILGASEYKQWKINYTRE